MAISYYEMRGSFLRALGKYRRTRHPAVNQGSERVRDYQEAWNLKYNLHWNILVRVAELNNLCTDLQNPCEVVKYHV